MNDVLYLPGRAFVRVYGNSGCKGCDEYVRRYCGKLKTCIAKERGRTSKYPFNYRYSVSYTRDMFERIDQYINQL